MHQAGAMDHDCLRHARTHGLTSGGLADETTHTSRATQSIPSPAILAPAPFLTVAHDMTNSTSLAFKGVSCTVTHSDGRSKFKKTILHPFSGLIEPGSVVGVMGPSGSGKTTLLDILSNKKAPKTYEGRVFVNGQQRCSSSFKRISVYVPQESIYNGNEIVREVLDFSALLKTNWGPADRNLLVNGALEFLGLEHVAHQYVGNTDFKGISGGQRRRLSVGKALVTHAKLVFCDEPTSGLSSTDATILLSGIRRIATTCGVTFVIVIHQPCVEVFDCFDRVMLMSQGKCVYNGLRRDMERYFARIGYPLPPFVNPAEFYMDLVTPGCTTYCLDFLVSQYDRRQAPHYENAVDALSDSRRDAGSRTNIRFSDTSRETAAELLGQSASSSKGDEVMNCSESNQKCDGEIRVAMNNPSTYWKQYRALQWRSFVLAWRDKNAFFLEFSSILTFTVLIGVLFLNVYAEKAIVFQLATHMLMCMTLGIIPFVNSVMYLERKRQYLYETSDGYYTALPYLLAETVTNVVVTIGSVLVSLLLLFCMCGFPFNKFPVVFLFYVLFLLVLDAAMQLFSAICTTYMMVNTIGGGWLFIASMINGLNVNPQAMPPALRIFVFLSPFFLVFEGTAIALYWKNDGIWENEGREEIFGFSSALHLLDAFGLAGRTFGISVDPIRWMWLVDFLSLFLLLIVVKIVSCFYQAYYVVLKK